MGSALNTPYQASNPYDRSVLQAQVNNLAQINQGQNELASLLGQQAMGQGPNPAQIQYGQNVQNNIANAQGLIAGQRGLNPALAAKMGANQASQMNQQAAAQSSLLNAEQQLGAQANLGNLYGQMQQGNLGQQQLYTGAAQNTQNLNANLAAGNQERKAKVFGSVMNALGGAAAMNQGGEVGGPKSKLGQSLMSMPMNYEGGGQIPGIPQHPGNDIRNDIVPINASKGEIVLPNTVTQAPDAPAKAAKFVAAIMAKNGTLKKK